MAAVNVCLLLWFQCVWDFNKHGVSFPSSESQPRIGFRSVETIYYSIFPLGIILFPNWLFTFNFNPAAYNDVSLCNQDVPFLSLKGQTWANYYHHCLEANNLVKLLALIISLSFHLKESSPSPLQCCQWRAQNVAQRAVSPLGIRSGQCLRWEPASQKRAAPCCIRTQGLSSPMTPSACCQSSCTCSTGYLSSGATQHIWMHIN